MKFSKMLNESNKSSYREDIGLTNEYLTDLFIDIVDRGYKMKVYSYILSYDNLSKIASDNLVDKYCYMIELSFVKSLSDDKRINGSYYEDDILILNDVYTSIEHLKSFIENEDVQRVSLKFENFNNFSIAILSNYKKSESKYTKNNLSKAVNDIDISKIKLPSEYAIDKDEDTNKIKLRIANPSIADRILNSESNSNIKEILEFIEGYANLIDKNISVLFNNDKNLEKEDLYIGELNISNHFNNSFNDYYKDSIEIKYHGSKIISITYSINIIEQGFLDIKSSGFFKKRNKKFIRIFGLRINTIVFEY